MVILVVSKVSIPDKDRTLPAWSYLRGLGYEIIVEHPGSVPTDRKVDAIISMGVTVMEETFEAVRRFPGILLGCFNWDCYEWVWTNPRPGEYDYKRYGELLRQAAIVWVPSFCTARRTEQWWPWTKGKCQTILSACPWWDSDKVHDGGYALCTLRHIPDPWDTKFEEACEAIRIPYLRTDHNLSRQEYEDAVAGCCFMVSHYYEASTGGLTLLEAYRLGKPCLINNSEWNGAKDYFGNRARYFQAGDEQDFKVKLLGMHQNPPVLDVQECKTWIETNHNDFRMVDQMVESIKAELARSR